ncbi:MAG: hypothetical protein J1F35_05420 [Erysipelotrichales bacterium]|nr:hypothetical protein [Erysipelotrichales bacterium]
MKILRYLLTFMIFMFVLTFGVKADSAHFEPFVEMYTDITENQIRMTLGFSGEEIMTIKGTVSYDPSKLTLADVEELDNFTVTTSLEDDENGYRTFSILADSDYSFNESYYATLVFDVNPGFKNKKKSDIFFYDFTAGGPEKIKFRSSGFITTLNRISISEMNYVLNTIDKNTKTKYWFTNHFYLFVIGFLVIVMIVVIIFLIPSRRKKEKRDQNAQDSTKAENYDPNASNIKIDPAAIEQIGKVEKEIDMSQAIVVNEDIKPFGDIVGKNDEIVATQEQVQPQEAILNAFEARSPEQYENNQATVDTSDIANQAAQTAPTQEEVQPKIEELNAFNQTPTIQDNNTMDNLAVINPQTFDEAETPTISDVTIETPAVEKRAVVNQPKTLAQQLAEPAEFEPQVQASQTPQSATPKLQSIEPAPLGAPTLNNQTSTTSNNNGSNTVSSIIILFMIALSIITLNVVYADEYQIEDLRSHIVSGKGYNKNLDYNGDGKIDVLDIIETKDLTNCSFDNLLSTDPGFAEIHGQSNNIISSDSNYVSSKGNASKRTTTKKNSSNNVDSGSNNKTTKKSSGGSSLNGGNTASNMNGTTTKKTTTTKASSSKEEAKSYQVDITAVNGSVSESSFTMQADKTKTINLISGDGYVIDANQSRCNNVSYSFNGVTKLVLAHPTYTATCSLIFVPIGNIKITLKYYTGKGNSTKQAINYTSKSLDNGGNGVYNETWSTGLALPTGYKVRENPSCGSYMNGVFSIKIPAKSTSCTLYFDPLLYNFNVYVSEQSTPINDGTDKNIYYGESKKIEFYANTVYSTVTCSDGQTPKLTKFVGTPNRYYFTYEQKTTNNVACNVS